MSNNNEYVRQIAEQKYEFGFTTDVQTEIIEKGLNEDIVRLISAKKESLNGCSTFVCVLSVTGKP